MVVTHPELYSGAWETEQPTTGAIDGIQLQMSTVVREGAEYLQRLEIKVYHAQGKETTRAWFSAHDGTDTTWDGKRLRLKFQPAVAGEVSLDLDLVFDASAQNWSGTFGRDGLVRSVRLLRPGASAALSNRFVGDWFAQARTSGQFPYSATCIHIAEESNHTMVVWEDRKSGRIINAPIRNQYGIELAVESQNSDSIQIGPGPSSFGGNRITFAGSLSADGSQIEGHWATNGNPSRHSMVLVKSTGEGFSASPSSP